MNLSLKSVQDASSLKNVCLPAAFSAGKKEQSMAGMRV